MRCASSSKTASVPGEWCPAIPVMFAIEPDGKNSAASLPSILATRSSRRRTVGSPSSTSSPTSALAIAWRIAAVGLVTVSERMSIGTGKTGREEDRKTGREEARRAHRIYLGAPFSAVLSFFLSSRQRAGQGFFVTLTVGTVTSVFLVPTTGF